MIEGFTTKERKKEFDKIFKEKILPLFNNYGFTRHTKTSKRVFKNLENKLAVFIFIEYKKLFEFYDITIAYFDEAIGTVYDDNYLAMMKGKFPSFSGNNPKELNVSVDKWLLKMELEIFPFIEKHTTHRSILESENFYISKSREEKIVALLRMKSNL